MHPEQTDLDTAVDEWITVLDQLDVNTQANAETRPDYLTETVRDSIQRDILAQNLVAATRKRTVDALDSGSEDESSSFDSESSPHRDLYRDHYPDKRKAEFRQALTDSIIKLAESLTRDIDRDQQSEDLVRELRDLKEEFRQFKFNIEKKLDLLLSQNEI
jgi:hypothetical protein